MVGTELLKLTEPGLYCPQGDFHIDPAMPVKRAVVTHAHSDHARAGHSEYIVTGQSEPVIRRRSGADIHIRALAYGETIRVNGVGLSLHPAGHVLGSAQARIEYRGEVWVVSGDYKTAMDPTCEPFEPVRCHTFVTESTFALPVFRWKKQNILFAEIDRWWKENAESGRTSLLFAYAFGKAQRLLAGIDRSIGPVYTHGAVENINQIYRHAGIDLPETRLVSDAGSKTDFKGSLVVAPPSADNPAWLKKFPDISRAMASGWMQIRGNRRRRSLDRGFAVSDHSDWPGILSAVEATRAEKVWTMHGYDTELARYLREEKGLDAVALTDYGNGAINLKPEPDAETKEGRGEAQ